MKFAQANYFGNILSLKLKDIITNYYFLPNGSLQKNFLKIKNNSLPMLVVEPLTFDLWDQNFTTRPPWQVNLKVIQVCAQQNTPVICNSVVGSEFGQFGKIIQLTFLSIKINFVSESNLHMMW